MKDCPNCEYHKKRAQLWRDEAYKLGGHELPSRWEGLTDEDIFGIFGTYRGDADYNHDQLLLDARRIEAKLKEKNCE
jgi:hypothetical protein